MDYHEALESCLNGGGYLFCGAGFSADCLNFDDIEIGGGYPLLQLLNEELSYSFDDLQTAADEFIQTKGHTALMALLKNRYQVVNIPQSILDVLSFPWVRIYTTNYDDCIAMALKKLGKAHRRISNLDFPSKEILSGSQNIVHLHGSVECWDDYNFDDSCILGGQSYYRHDNTNKWKNQLEYDFNCCKAFFFVGFSARDYYLNRVFFNASASRDKVFFVNQVGSQDDRQLIASQRNFGISLPIGRDDFSQRVKESLGKPLPTEPHLASFSEIQLSPTSDTAPGVDSVTDHLVFGRLNSDYLMRDIDKNSSDYRVKRDPVEAIIQHISIPGNVALITGSVCTGKSLLALEIMQQVRRSRPVFQLRIAYSDVTDEVRRIIKAYPDCLLCIEECFFLDEQLVEIAEIVEGTRSNLLLTCRDVAYDAAADGLIASASSKPDRVQRFPLSKMTDTEVDGFVALSERIAGWRELSGKSPDWKRRYIKNKCHANMAEFLLHLLKSETVRKKVENEYCRCLSTSPRLKKPLIVSLYLQHIGLPVQLEVLSTLLENDVGAELGRIPQSSRFELIRREGAYVRTLPSIGARELLRSIVPDAEIVATVTEVIHSLLDNRRYGHTYTHIFNQFMRYPILQGVVESKAEIDHFFDQLSIHSSVQRQTHFWLQFSMAKSDFGEFEKAEQYLENAYGIVRERYNTTHTQPFKQLDDQKAKFLLRSRTKSLRYDDHLEVLQEVTQIIHRILDMPELTFHIFDTLSLYCDFISEKYPGQFHESQHDLVRTATRNLAKKSKERSATLTEFHAKTKANNALVKLSALDKKLSVQL